MKSYIKLIFLVMKLKGKASLKVDSSYKECVQEIFKFSHDGLNNKCKNKMSFTSSEKAKNLLLNISPHTAEDEHVTWALNLLRKSFGYWGKPLDSE